MLVIILCKSWSIISVNIFSTIPLFEYRATGLKLLDFSRVLAFLIISLYCCITPSISFCISSFPLPSADVLIISPKPCGKTLFTKSVSLFLSWSFSIFLEIVINSEFGINTTNLPGIVMCVETLAPFLFVLSLFTCTNIGIPVCI